MKRPFLVLILLNTAGILLGDAFPLPFLTLLVVSVAIAAVGFLFDRSRIAAVLFLLIAIGWTNVCFREELISPLDLRGQLGIEPRYVTIQGALATTAKVRRFDADNQPPSWHSVAQVDVTGYLENTNWHAASGRILASTSGALSTNFFKGQNVSITGLIGKPANAAAPGLFDYETYLRRQGIYYQLKTTNSDDWVVVTGPATMPWSDRFLHWAQERLHIGLEDDETMVAIGALALDVKTSFTDKAEEPFMQAGTYHIFAVDGLRIAIVTGILLAFFHLLRLPRVVCGGLVIGCVWFYTAATGWPASAIRAAIMMSIIVGGWSLNRPSDLVNSIFAAAFIILLIDPQQLFQAGFQLSFVVVLCIALFLPYSEKLRNMVFKKDPLLPDELRSKWQRFVEFIGRYLFDILLASFAAWIGSIPLAAYYFHLFSPVSTSANFLVVPLTGFTLISCLMSLLFGWIPFVADIFNHASAGLMVAITWLSQWSTRWPKAFFYISEPSLITIGFYYLVLFSILTRSLWKASRKIIPISILSAVALLWIGFEVQEHKTTRLHIVPLEGGYTTFVQNKNHPGLLVDCGATHPAEFITKPFLRAQGVNRLDQFLLSHGDSRFTDGANVVITNFLPQRFFTSAANSRSPVYKSIIEQLKSRPENWNRLSSGDSLNHWTILHPSSKDQFSRADDNAIVMTSETEGIKILLLSDLGRDGQRALLDRKVDLKADILISGIPRTEEPLSESLLEAVQPRVVIIPDSDHRYTERASKDLIARLADRKFKVLYGHNTGALTLVLRHHTCEIQNANGHPLLQLN